MPSLAQANITRDTDSNIAGRSLIRAMAAPAIIAIVNLEGRISIYRYGATDTIIPVSQIEEEMVLPSITGLKELIKKVLKYV